MSAAVPVIAVVTGGELATPPAIRPELVIAADSGVEHALSLGWSVDIAVGDFDSVDPAALRAVEESGAEIRRFPADKDATDLQLALDVALERAPAHVTSMAIEGGRPDHALANMLVAAHPRYSPLEIELALQAGTAYVVHHQLQLELPAGRLVSLLPVHGPATVSIVGVRWPLRRATLDAGTTQGISNEATDGSVALIVHDGTVVTIVPDPEEIP